MHTNSQKDQLNTKKQFKKKSTEQANYKQIYYQSFVDLSKKFLQLKNSEQSLEIESINNSQQNLSQIQDSIKQENLNQFNIQSQDEQETPPKKPKKHLDLDKYQKLATQAFSFHNKKKLINYILHLLNKKKIIRSNNIDTKLLNDLDEDIIEFKDLFKLCIFQLVYSYSIIKKKADENVSKYQEYMIRKYYEEQSNKSFLQKFLNKKKRKRKIQKNQRSIYVKTNMINDLKSINNLNYLKIYKFLTQFQQPSKNEFVFQSKITNVINDCLAFLKRQEKFLKFFQMFQEHYLDFSKKKLQQKPLYMEKYIKRFPLHKLMQFIHQKEEYKNLFIENINKKKLEIIDKFLNPKLSDKPILDLFIFIDIFVSLFQIISLQKSMERIFKKNIKEQKMIQTKLIN